MTSGHTISFTRQVQTKLNFKLLHAFGPQNTGQVETKVLLQCLTVLFYFYPFVFPFILNQ